MHIYSYISVPASMPISISIFIYMLYIFYLVLLPSPFISPCVYAGIVAVKSEAHFGIRPG